MSNFLQRVVNSGLSGLPSEAEPGGRPPDPDSSAGSTRVGGSRQSTSPASAYQDAHSSSPDRAHDQSTVHASGGGSSSRTVTQGSAVSQGLAGAPQSTLMFGEVEGSPGQHSPTVVALSARLERQRAQTLDAELAEDPPSRAWTTETINTAIRENGDVRAAHGALVASYSRKRELIDLDENGLIILERDDGTLQDSEADPLLVTLEDRVAMLRDLTFSSRLLDYADPVTHRGPALKEGVYALFENVANSVTDLLQACFSELPWAGIAPWPKEDWYADAIASLSKPYATVGQLARAFNVAQGWVNHVAGIIEAHLRMREPSAIPAKPRSFSRGLDHYASFGTPARKKTSDEGSDPQFQSSPAGNASCQWTPKDQDAWRKLQSGTPASEENFYERTVSRNVLNPRRVTIAKPIASPLPTKPTKWSSNHPASEGYGVTQQPQVHYFVGNDRARPSVDLLAGIGTPLLRRKPRQSDAEEAAAHLTMRAAVEDAEARPALLRMGSWRDSPPHGQATDTSRDEVSRQLATRRGTLSPRLTRASLERSLALFADEPALPAEKPMGTMGPEDAEDARFFGLGQGYAPYGTSRREHEDTQALPPQRPSFVPASAQGGGGGGYPGGGGRAPAHNNNGQGSFSRHGGGGPPSGGRGSGPGRPPTGPPAGGGGGGSGGGGGGGGYPPAGAAPADVPRIDTKFRIDALPSWDGQPTTALAYFAELRKWAELGGSIPQQLGTFAPLRFKQGAAEWWEAISLEDRQALRRDVYSLIGGIKQGLLTRTWIRDLTMYCNSMGFRQPGYSKESLRRRAVVVNALYNFSEEEQVSYILSKAPIPWVATLGDRHIDTVAELLQRAAEQEQQLEQAAISDLELDKRIQLILDRYSRPAGRQFVRRAPVVDPGRDSQHYQKPPPARANFAAPDGERELIDFSVPRSFAEREAPDEEEQDPEDPYQDLFKSASAPPRDLARAYQIYAYLAAKKKSPPPGGYKFPKYDLVSKPPPPFDCRFCGGCHWHRECIHNDAGSKKGTAMLVAHDLPPDEGLLYAIAEGSAMSSRSTYVSLRDIVNAHPDLAPDEGWVVPTDLEPDHVRKERTPVLEEIPDRWVQWQQGSGLSEATEGPILLDQQPRRNVYREASPQLHSRFPYERDLTLYSPPLASIPMPLHKPIDPDYTDGYLPSHAKTAFFSRTFEVDQRRDVTVLEDEFDVWYRASSKARVGLLELGGDGYSEPDGSRQAAIFAAALSAEATQLPAVRKVEIAPRRRLPEGHSSVGMGVLSVPGKLVSAEEDTVLLRLDSGASISLIAEDYIKQLKDPPKIRPGLKIDIAQLTDQSPRLKGYVTLPVRIRAEDGSVIVLRAELYVVPGMTVPVLLGEDFQFSYELNVLRNIELGTKVLIGDSGISFKASSTAESAEEQVQEASKLARGYKVIPKGLPSFVAAKQHRRHKANRQRRKRATAYGALRAWENVLIPAETTKLVTVAGDLQQGREWYVERFLIPQSDETFLTVPNTLLDLRTTPAGRAEPGSIARCSQLSVSNPTKIPRILRAGTLIGYAKDPQEYLDAPHSEKEWAEFTARAETYAALTKEMQGDLSGSGDTSGAQEVTQSAQAEAPGLRSASTLEQQARAHAVAPEPPDGPLSAIPDFGTADELQPLALAEAPDPETLLRSSRSLQVLTVRPRSLRRFAEHETHP